MTGTLELPDVAAPSRPAASVNPLVVGLDLSLAATGIAHHRAGSVITDTLRGQGRGIVRLRKLVRSIEQHCTSATLVVIEGPSYGSLGAGFHERAGLHWLIEDRLWRAGIAYAIVPPSVVKKYATGKGNAGKGAMVAAATRRYPQVETGGDDNQVDALWLAALGLDHLTGERVVPEAHRVVLGSVTWPTIAMQVIV